MRADQSKMQEKWRLPEDLKVGSPVLLVFASLSRAVDYEISGPVKVLRFTPAGKIVVPYGESETRMFKPTPFGWEDKNKFSSTKLADPSREPWKTKLTEKEAEASAEKEAKLVLGWHLQQQPAPTQDGLVRVIRWLRERRDRLLKQHASAIDSAQREMNWAKERAESGVSPYQMNVREVHLAQQYTEIQTIDDVLWQLRFHLHGTEAEIAMARAREELGEELDHYDKEALGFAEKSGRGGS